MAQPSLFSAELPELKGTLPHISWAARLARFQRNWRTRRALADLDGHMLRDIGLTPAEARRETDRPPWDSLD